MCYLGKCIYENYMEDCIAPSKEKNACAKGHRIAKRELLKFKVRAKISSIRYKISKKYRNKINSLPF